MVIGIMEIRWLHPSNISSCGQNFPLQGLLSRELYQHLATFLCDLSDDEQGVALQLPKHTRCDPGLCNTHTNCLATKQLYIGYICGHTLVMITWKAHMDILQIVDCTVKVAKLMATVGRKHDDSTLVSGNE